MVLVFKFAFLSKRIWAKVPRDICSVYVAGIYINLRERGMDFVGPVRVREQA
jgi:hypothetical protein